MSAFTKLTARIGELREGESDLADRLDDLAKAHPDGPDWRRSIVDLLKVLGLDASYGARKSLAVELGYLEETILTKGSSEMNLWLIGEVTKRLAA